jgi:hypothetical protein
MERNDTATQSEETTSVPLTRVDQALTSFNLTGFGGTRHVSQNSRCRNLEITLGKRLVFHNRRWTGNRLDLHRARQNIFVILQGIERNCVSSRKGAIAG